MQGPRLNNLVINLTQVFKLSPAQFQLLDRGLSSHSVRPFDKGPYWLIWVIFKKNAEDFFFGPTSNSSKARTFFAKSDRVPPPQVLPGEVFDFYFFDRNFESVNEIATQVQALSPNLSPNVRKGGILSLS